MIQWFNNPILTIVNIPPKKKLESDRLPEFGVFGFLGGCELNKEKDELINWSNMRCSECTNIP